MPGGTAAGTVLGLNFFLVLFNGAGPTANSTSIGQQITKPINKRKPIAKTKVKWVDDVTLCPAVDLKAALVKGEAAKTRPPETLNCSKSKTCRAKKLKLNQPVNLIS